MSNERETLFIHVLLPLAMPGQLTYRVPWEMNELITAGKRVVVPVGKKKLYAGIITDISNSPPSGFEARYLLTVLDDVPVVHQKQLEFWSWMADYYMCTRGEVMRAALPAALKLESESYITPDPGYDGSALLDPEEEMIVQYLEKAGEVSISAAAVLAKKHSIFKLVKSLYQKGVILMKEDLSDHYRPRKISCIRINPEITDEEMSQFFHQLERRAPKQLEALMQVYSWKAQFRHIERSRLMRDGGLNAAAIKGLTEKGLLEMYEVDKSEFQQDETTELPELTRRQLEVLLKIRNDWQDHDVCLLHGATSSGKTLIYFHLIHQVLKEGKQVLYMVPELALTAQLVERFRRHFGNDVDITHSGFSQNDRMETFTRLSSGKIRIILGVRSSLFMPFRDLGLVIVDEEHESTLKQQEPSPRYHARESAILLAKLSGAKVLLGSATPSIESWHNAHSGKYGFATLNERYGNSVMPEIQLVNLSDAVRGNRMRGPFTTDMLEALDDVLKQKRQAILFQNRRGYVPVTECSLCGWTPKCVNCDISLTYYTSGRNYRCNLCGYKQDVIIRCGACGNTKLKFIGYGTERLEEDLKMMLPNARIARFDSESARNRKQMEAIIKAFENKETDILVGTQMLSKGLDFENLDFVGVVNADHLFHFPDFRAVERSFQLLVQVAGRAGRRDRPGKVMIQTYQPGHKVLEAIVNSELLTLYDWELEERRTFHYPPFTRLIRIIVKHAKESVVTEAADHLGQALKDKLGTMVLGPESPYIGKVRNLYLKHLILKFDPEKVSPAKLKRMVSDQIQRTRSVHAFRQVIILPDVDPV